MCCGTLRQNRKEMPEDFGNTTLDLNQGEIYVNVWDVMAAVMRKIKWDVWILLHTYIYPQQKTNSEMNAEELTNLPLLKTIVCMWPVWQRGQNANSCSFSQRTGKWTKTCFHLFEVTQLNSCTILISCDEAMPRVVDFSSHRYLLIPNVDMSQYSWDLKCPKDKYIVGMAFILPA
jgi:hypothetical protein